jgi:hypothetical protein
MYHCAIPNREHERQHRSEQIELHLHLERPRRRKDRVEFTLEEQPVRVHEAGAEARNEYVPMVEPQAPPAGRNREDEEDRERDEIRGFETGEAA